MPHWGGLGVPALQERDSGAWHRVGSIPDDSMLGLGAASEGRALGLWLQVL